MMSSLPPVEMNAICAVRRDTRLRIDAGAIDDGSRRSAGRDSVDPREVRGREADFVDAQYAISFDSGDHDRHQRNA